jgi:hypothetical protein
MAIRALKTYGFPSWYLESPSFIKSICLLSSIFEYDCDFINNFKRYLRTIIDHQEPMHDFTLREVEYYRALEVAKERGIAPQKSAEAVVNST